MTLKVTILASVFVAFLIYKIYIVSSGYIKTGKLVTINNVFKVNDPCIVSALIQIVLLYLVENLLHKLNVLASITITLVCLLIYIFVKFVSIKRKEYIEKECRRTADKR